MRHFVILFLLMIVFAPAGNAQKMAGFGGELSVVGAKINYRSWLSRKTGYEIFGGVTAEFDDLMPNDPEAGLKYLHTFIFNRADRTYIGLMAKWKWVDVDDSDRSTNLPIPGILVGKEWFNKKRKLKGFAIEVGYQFGTKEYNVYNPVIHNIIGQYQFNELPLILNFRYSFYQKRR